jgi:SAM-dependent methyltransferase
MRKAIRALVRLIADALPVAEPIYEFGALQVPGQEYIADLRPLFPGKEYIGCDVREGTGVDRVLDLHDLDLPDEVAGTVFMFETLEHVEYPRKAMSEVYRVLRTGGFLAMTSVLNFQIHEYPYDYWRFTPQAFRSLLKQFDTSFVGFAGNPVFPHTVVGIGFKGCSYCLDDFAARYEIWKKRWRRLEKTPFWLPIAYRATPPFLRRIYRKAKLARYARTDRRR